MYRCRRFYFAGESFDENGDKEVEEDVVAEGHESDEVKGGPRRRLGHSLVQHLVPVLLRQDLQHTPKHCAIWRTRR